MTSEEEAADVALTDESAVELLLRFIRAGHRAGYPTAELEERVLALGEAFGLPEPQISATPTVVEISLGTLPRQRSFTLRVRPPTVDLDAIARLDEAVQDVLDGRLDAAAALAAVADVQARPLDRPWPVLLGAYAIAGAALTPVLGGTWREAIAAALVGTVVGAIALPVRNAARTEAIVAPLAAVAASFTAAALAQLDFDASPDVVTLAALVTFLPGVTLTIGMRELATEHLQSGVANTASALVQLLGLVFGVGIGRSIAASWFGATSSSPPDPSFTAIQIFAAVAAGFAFTLTLRARNRDALVMAAATVLALSGRELGALLFGDPAAVFVAALLVGSVGGVVGFVLRRSPLVFIVPGVLMLVPGSDGFNSLLQLLSEHTVSGVSTAFDTFVTAMSIAYGLMVSTLILPRRFTELTPHRHGLAGTDDRES
jgi:uncharacterized membrane protein YjjP (DUF1212 family)